MVPYHCRKQERDFLNTEKIDGENRRQSTSIL